MTAKEPAQYELKPCPFCGSEDAFLQYYEENGRQTKYLMVICDECASRTDGWKPQYKAINAWNRRAK